MKRTLLVALTTTFVATAVSSVEATMVEDFSSTPAGTIVRGDTPQGNVADGAAYTNFTILDVVNNSGPQSLMVFDSSNPSGGDPDLGTPNETCTPPGPGVGVGGEVGQPGENCEAMGNILVIAENLTDTNNDDIVDSPDDDRDGGRITIEFAAGVAPVSITLIDIDQETASVHASNDTLMVTVDASDLGDNSVQKLDISGEGLFQSMVVVFSSSGGICEIEYDFVVSVSEATWGAMKAMYR
jgi:hypothetical protein